MLRKKKDKKKEEPEKPEPQVTSTTTVTVRRRVTIPYKKFFEMIRAQYPDIPEGCFLSIVRGPSMQYGTGPVQSFEYEWDEKT